MITSCRLARGRPRRWLSIGGILMATVIGMVCMGNLQATPPEYKTFKRDQRKEYTPSEGSILRIWIVDVGQGDGIFIQLPEKFNYDVEIDGQTRRERIDVLVDSGPASANKPLKIGTFIDSLYPNVTPVIEHAVITHHDADHVEGITRLISDGFVRVETIYHNGLVSWLPGGTFPSTIPTSQKAIYLGTKAVPKRGMAFIETDGTLEERFLINDLTELQNALDSNDLHGIYADLARAVGGLAQTVPSVDFRRCFRTTDFINEVETIQRTAITEIQFELLWPEQPAMPYKSSKGSPWSYTINGNSVTFRLVYKDFAMLFSGDHNEASEKAFLQSLIAANNTQALDCDVFKVPHHGSSHFDSAFIDTVFKDVVLSVASMGSRGFGNGWKHPFPALIRKLGRAHRFYSTYIHEKNFDLSTFEDARELEKMIEKDRKTILIETDGKWFRLVETNVDHIDLNNPPTVAATGRSHGTRWIEAK